VSFRGTWGETRGGKRGICGPVERRNEEQQYSDSAGLGGRGDRLPRSQGVDSELQGNTQVRVPDRIPMKTARTPGEKQLQHRYWGRKITAEDRGNQKKKQVRPV